MNRLTRVEGLSTLIKDGWKKKDTGKNYTSICYGCEEIRKCVNKCGFCKALDKLAAYEDTGLEPEEIKKAEHYKIGDIVYYLEDYGMWLDNKIYMPIKCEVNNIFIDYEGKFYYYLESVDELMSIDSSYDEIPEQEIYRTREEAEKALEEQ